jgi:hypothetical protein
MQRSAVDVARSMGFPVLSAQGLFLECRELKTKTGGVVWRRVAKFASMGMTVELVVLEEFKAPELMSQWKLECIMKPDRSGSPYLELAYWEPVEVPSAGDAPGLRSPVNGSPAASRK